MNLQKALNHTVYASLFVQIVIGILDIYFSNIFKLLNKVPMMFRICSDRIVRLACLRLLNC
jgi:hypothetical protein